MGLIPPRILFHFPMYLYVFVCSRVGHPFFSKERSVLSVLFRSFLKNGTFFPFFSVLFKRTERSFRSFPFFSKERNVLSVLFRSLQKNVPFFPFFSVPLKRTERSLLRSFPNLSAVPDSAESEIKLYLQLRKRT